MQFKSFTVNPFQQNTYLAYQDGNAWLLDAGFYHQHEMNSLIQFLNEHQLELKAIFLTHAHLDHIFGLNALVELFHVPVFLHDEEILILENAHKQGAKYGIPMEAVHVAISSLEESDKFILDDFSCRTLFTPGHSPGHISFYFENEGILIAGDTLFAGSIGRTDLYRGDFAQLEKSIKEKLYTLPEETRVLSGHGPETSIGQEKHFNSYVRA
ncbi:MBL fold metallo-hydrolase [bacterium]|nr:MAG: MBL fold metallo-hydrolase [bacterium]